MKSHLMSEDTDITPLAVSSAVAMSIVYLFLTGHYMPVKLKIDLIAYYTDNITIASSLQM